jgi:large subunit ribosomal protein L14
MLRQESNLKIIDNTGAKYARVIRKLGKNAKNIQVGDLIVVHITGTVPNSLIKKGDVCRALIIRTKYPFKRSNGDLIFFSENSAVLVDNDGNPKGTRVFGPVPRELKVKNFTKVISISSEII